MQVKVVLQNKTLIDKKATYIHFICENGEAGMYDNHAPIIMLGKNGFLIIRDENGVESFIAYQNGILKVANNKASLLASLAVVSNTKDKAKEKLDSIFSTMLSRSKKETADFSKIEKDLFDNIKKAGAGFLWQG